MHFILNKIKTAFRTNNNYLSIYNTCREIENVNAEHRCKYVILSHEKKLQEILYLKNIAMIKNLNFK